MATFDEWEAAYSAVYEALPGDAHVACPNCGYDALRVVFTGDPERMVGYAHFWCENCRLGIGISRAPIPDGAVMRDIRDAPENRLPKIPSYTLVPPG
jgi:hypothetical protein